MREHKYRAWDGHRMTTSGIMFSSSTGAMFTAADMPLMQYTGLKDKNGVEIYEGDILTDNSLVDDETTQYKAIVRWGKHWGNMGFFLDTNCKCGEYHSMCDDVAEIEVIGNIYQNGDLLE